MATNSVGSGQSVIDVESIVSSLMQVERKRVTKVDNKINAKDVQISSMGSLKSKASALEQSLAALNSSAMLAGRTASSSDPSRVTASVSSDADVGSIDVRVVSTAMASRVVGGAFASPSSPVGNGTLTLQLGSYTTHDGVTRFEANRSVPALLPKDATLTDLKDVINNSGAGMTASIVKTSDTYSLVVTGGVAAIGNDIRIAISDVENVPGGGAPDLTSIAYSAASDEPSAASLAQSARSAVVYVNGIRIERSSNHIEDVVPGVTLQLLKDTNLPDVSEATPVSVSVSEKEGQLRSRLDSLVSAYNDFYKTYSSLATPGAGGAGRGSLAAESSMRSLINRVRDALGEGMTYSSTSGGQTTSGTVRFWQLGIELQRDGTLKLDETKYAAAVSSGIADRIKSGVTVSAQRILNEAISLTGQFDSRTNALQDAKRALQNSKTTLEEKMTTLESSYRRRYASLDALLQKMSSVNDSVGKVLEQLNSQNNG